MKSRSTRLALGVGAAVLALAILSELLGSLFGEPSGKPASSYATASSGLAAYAELLQRSGHPVSQRRSSLAATPIDPASTLVVLDPDGFSPADARAVRAFVSAGGTLVAGGQDPAGWLGGVLPHLPRWSAAGPAAWHPVASVPGVALVRSAGDGSFSSTNGYLPELSGGAQGPYLALAGTLGRGHVELLASASPLENSLLAAADNPVLAASLAGAPGRPVAFAESVHGYGATSGLDALPSSWKGALAGLALAALLWIGARVRRLGPPEDQERELAPARGAFVDAVAASLARTRERSRAAEPVREAARDLLARRAGLGPDPDDEALRRAAEARGLDGEALLVPAGDERQMVAQGRALARLSSEER